MSEENKTLARRWIEEMDKKNFAIIEELATPSSIFYYPGMEPFNREAEQDLMKAFYSAFPDIQHTIHELIAEGDKVVSRVTLRGTHSGDFQGIAPTGKQVTLEFPMIDHIVGGKIQEHRVYYDQLGFLQQLGVAPGQ